LGCAAEAVLTERSRCDDPELEENLRDDEQLISSRSKHGHGFDRRGVLLVPVLKTTRQDVRIEENPHSPWPL
jgi:hypothetical protein